MKTKTFATGGNGPKPTNSPKPADDTTDMPADPAPAPAPAPAPMQ